MSNLFLSFCIAITVAVSLVLASHALELDFYSSRIFPLIPVLYALVFQTLEKLRTGETRTIAPARAREEMQAGASALFRHITFGRIAGDVGISLAIKFSLEIALTAVYLAAGRVTFREAYGPFGIETIGRFLRGDHPWLAMGHGLGILALIALIVSLGTGLWIGMTGRGSAILEGVIAGAAVTFITTLTSFLSLYRAIEELANQAAVSLGYITHLGFVTVVALKVLFYGLWSGIARRRQDEAAAIAAARKAGRKQRKQA